MQTVNIGPMNARGVKDKIGVGTANAGPLK